MGNSEKREGTSCPVTSLLRMPISFSRADNVDGPFSSDRGIQRQFSENISSEDDLRSRIFGTFVVKFLACLRPLGGTRVFLGGFLPLGTPNWHPVLKKNSP